MRHLIKFPRRRHLVSALILLFPLLIIGIDYRQRVEALENNLPPATAVAAQASNPSVSGQWSQVIPMQDVPIHISLLPNGKLLYWGRDKESDLYDVQNRCNTFLFDSLYADLGASGTKTIENTYSNLFCSGHSFLPDGRLFVTGGHKRPANPGNKGGEGYGEPKLNIFDYRTNTWTKPMRQTTDGPQPLTMAKGRWYPFNLTLASGETIIVSGSFATSNGTSDGNRTKNTIPEIFDLNGGLRQAAEDMTIFSGRYNSNYPYIFLAPDGRVFQAYAPDLDNSSRFLNLSTNTWTLSAQTNRYHDQGTAVMYAPGQILLVGGANEIYDSANWVYEPGADAEVINLNDANPGWTLVSSMNYPRLYPTAALLPNGTVFVAGGTRCRGGNNIIYSDPEKGDGDQSCVNGQVLIPEIWEPALNKWTEMAPHSETRVYHTSVILLPDGRVMVGGGGLPVATGENGTDGQPCITMNDFNKFLEGFERCHNIGHKTAEIFSPPYLFDTTTTDGKAVRPAISSAPETLSYNQQFTVEVGNVPRSDIKEVVLVRLPSVTHTFNQDQRRVILQKQNDDQNPNALKVTVPADGNACPPGPYMMFLIRNNEKGTPSIAKMVKVGRLSLDRTTQTFLPNDYPGDAETLTGTIGIKAPAGVSWTASLELGNTWITLRQANVNGIVVGTGNGTVTFDVAPNTNSVRREPGRIRVRVGGEANSSHEFIVYQGGVFSDITYPLPVGAPTPSPTPPPPTQFHADISKIFARGVTLGVGNNNYGPASNVTRLQMAIFLTRMLGQTDLPDAPQRFSDIPMPADPNAREGYRAVEYLARIGVTDGCAPGLFCPNDPVNREQMAAFIIRALGITRPPTPSTDPFNDVPATYWAAPFIAEMKRLGITSGCNSTGTSYCPTTPVTREQMARFLRAAFKL